MEIGQILALVGAALAVFLGGIGSAWGVKIAGESAAGATAEDPEVFSKVLVLQLLPGTQGIYGFLIGVIVLVKTSFISGNMVSMTLDMGLRVLLGCLPLAIVALVSAYHQGKVAASAINMVGRRPDQSGKGITMTVLVETYAVLALLASFLMVWFAF
jgi:V/A-type H+-transporting ATPase subunit K